MESLTGDPHVKHALRVAAKVAVPGDQKLPLDRADVARVVAQLCARNDLLGSRDAAMCANIHICTIYMVDGDVQVE